jgi:hypothetical protein
MLNLIPTPYKILASVLLIVGVAGYSYYYGYSTAKTKADKELLEKENAAQASIIELQKQLSEAKDKVVIKFIEKTNTITERKYIYVDQAKNSPSKCELSSGWVYLHDSSAKGSIPDPAGSSDANSSGIRDNQALETVVSNYSTCRQTAEQLKSLQEWVRENNKIIEENNK